MLPSFFLLLVLAGLPRPCVLGAGILISWSVNKLFLYVSKEVHSSDRAGIAILKCLSKYAALKKRISCELKANSKIHTTMHYHLINVKCTAI